MSGIEINFVKIKNKTPVRMYNLKKVERKKLWCFKTSDSYPILKKIPDDTPMMRYLTKNQAQSRFALGSIPC